MEYRKRMREKWEKEQQERLQQEEMEKDDDEAGKEEEEEEAIPELLNHHQQSAKVGTDEDQLHQLRQLEEDEAIARMLQEELDMELARSVASEEQQQQQQQQQNVGGSSWDLHSDERPPDEQYVDRLTGPAPGYRIRGGAPGGLGDFLTRFFTGRPAMHRRLHYQPPPPPPQQRLGADAAQSSASGDMETSVRIEHPPPTRTIPIMGDDDEHQVQFEEEEADMFEAHNEPSTNIGSREGYTVELPTDEDYTASSSMPSMQRPQHPEGPQRSRRTRPRKNGAGHNGGIFGRLRNIFSR